MSDGTRISLPFHPFNFDNSGHVVEKSDDSGKKRRYLCGISSGINIDAHGERITKSCIDSMLEQCNSGDLLLYPDVHGIRASEDIGILDKAEIISANDWYTEYRLFDKYDFENDENPPLEKLATIDTLWKQTHGLPPYRRPKQKGFSIEGVIPIDGILDAQKDQFGNLSKRVINKIELDGVIFCPRPAYKSSVATAVYKALGELSPDRITNLHKSIGGRLREQMQKEEMQNAFYKKRWDLRDAIDSEIEKIMRKDDIAKQDQLKILFDEYTDLMINLILQSESLFIQDEQTDDIINPYSGLAKKSEKLDKLYAINAEIIKLKKSLTKGVKTCQITQ